MNGRANLQVSDADRSRIERIHALAEADGGLNELLDFLVDPSWVVRRALVSALASMGDAAVPALLDVLCHKRAHEARNAATVDALVGSCGATVDGKVLDLAGASTAAPVICDAVQVLGRRRVRSAIGRLAQLTEHPDDNVAVAALEALGRIGGPETVDALVKAATSTNFFRAFPALDALGRTEDARAVKPIAARLADPLYSLEALRALGRTGQATAVAPIAALLSSGTDSQVRAAAAALAELRDRYEYRHGSAERIVEMLRSAVDAPVTSTRVLDALSGVSGTELVSVVHVLGFLADPIAIGKMVELAVTDPPAGTAAQDALRRLGSLASREVIHALTHGTSLARARLLPVLADSPNGPEPLIACLHDEDPEVRCRACEAIARVGEGRAVSVLFGLLSDADARVSQAATAAIHALGSLDTKRLALERARSSDRSIRRAALRILAYFGFPESVELLVASAKDDDEQVRGAALHGLAQFANERAQEALLEATKHPSAKTRATAMRSLGQAKRSPGIEVALREAAKDPDEWVRYYACQSLGKLGIETAVDDLVARLDDASGQVRVSAIEALTCLRVPAAFDALVKAAQSEDADLHRSAIAGLGRHYRAEALPLLRDAVHHRAPATRLAALSALSGVSAPEVMPILTYATNDPEPSVRGAAIGYLATRLGSDATEALVTRAAHPDTRDRAVEALGVAADERIDDLLAMLDCADEERASMIAMVLSRLRRPSAQAALATALRFDNVHARRAAAAALVDVGSPEAIGALAEASVADADEAVRRIAAAAHSA